MFHKKLEGLDVGGGGNSGRASLFCCCVQKSQSYPDSLSAKKQEAETYGATEGAQVSPGVKEGGDKLANGSCRSEENHKSKVLAKRTSVSCTGFLTI